MSVPRLVAVDDSEAMLAFLSAVLESEYQLATAPDGRQGLQKIQSLRPDAVLLDLSMPQMSGDEVLAVLQRDEDLRNIPVVIISSEQERGAACVRNGAAAFLPKPIRADALRAILARVLNESAPRRESITVLFCSVGDREIGVPVSAVRSVVAQPRTEAINVGASYLSEVFDLHGQPVGVVDMARALRVDFRSRLEDRKLVVLAVGKCLVALTFDRVTLPEEIPAEALSPRPALSGADDKLLGRAIRAVARTDRGLRPILEPDELLSRQLLRRLAALVAQSSDEPTA